MILNLRGIVAEIETFFDFKIRKSTGISRYLNPPSWDKSIILTGDNIYKPLKIWLILCPILLSLTKTLPISIDMSLIKISIGKEFEIPFSWKMSFISAFFLFTSILIQKALIPDFLITHKKSLKLMPETIDKNILTKEYIKYALGGIPYDIYIRRLSCHRSINGSYSSGTHNDFQIKEGDILSNLVVMDGAILAPMELLAFRLSSSDQWKSIVDSSKFFYFNSKLIDKNNKPVMTDHTLDILSKIGTSIIELDNQGLKEVCENNDYLCSNMIDKTYPILFGHITMRENYENDIFSYLYDKYNNYNCIGRLLFWATYIIGFIIGFYVLFSLIIDGFFIIFNL